MIAQHPPGPSTLAPVEDRGWEAVDVMTMDDRSWPEVDDSGLEVLDADACTQLLRSTSVGRLGLTARSLPVILPLNFVVDGASVVFCTEPGSKLAAAQSEDVVCLEIDDADSLNHGGWSVVVTGRLREITDPTELAAVQKLPLAPWKPTRSRHYVRLSMELLSGRRLNQLHRTTWR